MRSLAGSRDDAVPHFMQDTRKRVHLEQEEKGKEKKHGRVSVAAPDDGFLARMMRPTTSSASKVHKTDAPAPAPAPTAAKPVPHRVRAKPSRTSLAPPVATVNEAAEEDEQKASLLADEASAPAPAVLKGEAGKAVQPVTKRPAAPPAVREEEKETVIPLTAEAPTPAPVAQEKTNPDLVSEPEPPAAAPVAKKENGSVLPLSEEPAGEAAAAGTGGETANEAPNVATKTSEVKQQTLEGAAPSSGATLDQANVQPAATSTESS